MSGAALSVRGVSAGYGNSDALRKVDLEVSREQITAVVGPNGAGKSTLMKVLAGIHAPRGGTVHLFGEDITTHDPRKRLAAGLSLCPERRRIFPGMTVEENLLLGAVTVRPRIARARVEETYDRVPWLRERRRSIGGNLSGGQQQILAILRAIMTAPSLLLLDEPSLGLSPRVVLEVAGLIRDLAADDMTVVIVEQNVSLGLKLAEQVHVLNQGEIIHRGTAQELTENTDLVSAYLG